MTVSPLLAQVSLPNKMGDRRLFAKYVKVSSHGIAAAIVCTASLNDALAYRIHRPPMIGCRAQEVSMRRTLLPSILLPLLCLGAPLQAQGTVETDSDYLQHRAATLKDRIDIAVKEHHLTGKKAAKLRLAVGKVQTEAGHLQTVNGTISRPDADRMNQKLTDVERTLTHQP